VSRGDSARGGLSLAPVPSLTSWLLLLLLLLLLVVTVVRRDEVVLISATTHGPGERTPR